VAQRRAGGGLTTRGACSKRLQHAEPNIIYNNTINIEKPEPSALVSCAQVQTEYSEVFESLNGSVLVHGYC
jgi:hypothetical protein